MQLMSVDSAVEVKYMDILQEDDEEKRKELEDGVSLLISNQNITSLNQEHNVAYSTPPYWICWVFF